MVITAKEYAAKIGYSAASITKRLNKQKIKSLPGALSVEKFGNTWLITLDPSFNKRRVKKLFKENLINSN